MRYSAFLNRLLRHPADRQNVALAFVAPVLLVLPFAIHAPLVYADLYGAVLFLFIGKANYVLHLQIHRPFSHARWLNIIVETCLGTVSSMTASNWRIQHLYGHHRGIDKPYRGDRSWQLEKYTPLRALSYPLLSILPTLCWPFVEAFRKGILADETSPLNYRWAFVEQALLIVLIAVLAMVNSTLVIFYLLPWYFVTQFITHYVDYLNHYGCDDEHDDPYRRANNSIDGGFNASTHNFGYHTVHHLRPSAHWTELPEIHRQIADRIPSDRLKPVSWSGLLLPYHLYLSRTGRM